MNMIDKEYSDIYDLCRTATTVFEKAANDDRLSDDGLQDVGIIVTHDTVPTFLHALMDLGYDLQCIRYEFEDEYDDEYLISISTLGGIWCEPVLRKNGYLYTEDFVTYILDTCNSAVLPYIKSDIIVAAHINDSENEDEEYCDCDKDEAILFEYSAIL